MIIFVRHSSLATCDAATVPFLSLSPQHRASRQRRAGLPALTVLYRSTPSGSRVRQLHIATRSGMPARTKFHTAVRRKSCKMRRRHPASTRAAAHAFPNGAPIRAPFFVVPRRAAARRLRSRCAATSRFTGPPPPRSARDEGDRRGPTWTTVFTARRRRRRSSRCRPSSPSAPPSGRCRRLARRGGSTEDRRSP